ncbi:hypothetical protein INR49_018725 [Caranx melampygus]|nr:hypothetical protein INR49_018725 [Caranx melampygus]
MLLPSDVARLVLGYLQEEGLTATSQAFIHESPNLKEYAEHTTADGTIPACSVFGKGLTTILNEYVAAKTKARSRIGLANMARQRVLTIASAGAVVCSSVSEANPIFSPAHTSNSMLGHSTPVSYTALHTRLAPGSGLNQQIHDGSRLLNTPSTTQRDTNVSDTTSMTVKTKAGQDRKTRKSTGSTLLKKTVVVPIAAAPDPSSTNRSTPSKAAADPNNIVSLKIIISDNQEEDTSSDPALNQAISSISGDKIPTIYLSSPAKSPGAPGTPKANLDEVAQAVKVQPQTSKTQTTTPSVKTTSTTRSVQQPEKEKPQLAPRTKPAILGGNKPKRRVEIVRCSADPQTAGGLVKEAEKSMPQQQKDPVKKNSRKQDHNIHKQESQSAKTSKSHSSQPVTLKNSETEQRSESTDRKYNHDKSNDEGKPSERRSTRSSSDCTLKSGTRKEKDDGNKKEPIEKATARSREGRTEKRAPSQETPSVTANKENEMKGSMQEQQQQSTSSSDFSPPAATQPMSNSQSKAAKPPSKTSSLAKQAAEMLHDIQGINPPSTPVKKPGAVNSDISLPQTPATGCNQEESTDSPRTPSQQKKGKSGEGTPKRLMPPNTPNAPTCSPANCLTCYTVTDMAANGASCEQPQKRAGAKDKQNGKSADSSIRERRQKDKEERLSMVLWRRPVTTLHYFLLETLIKLKEWTLQLWQRRGTVFLFLLLCCLFSIAYSTEGAHQQGPHIASVTLAAYECGSTDFQSLHTQTRLSVPKGAGTAIGELPPYFMARAARQSGADPDDEDYEEFEEMLEQAESAQDFVTRAKLGVQHMVQKVGFFGILACASIPNPLFDLAGITCGHFLVPFWTFFGATLIGKAIIKMHIQKLFVIITFSKHIVEQMVSLIGSVPRVGPSIQKPFSQYLEAQRNKLHHAGGSAPADENWLSWVFEKVVLVMVCYFVISIVNSMAQSYAKRVQQQRHSEEKTK